MATTIGEHIKTIVDADAALTVSLQGRIYPDVPAQAIPYPQAIYTINGGEVYADLSRAYSSANVVVDFDVWADSYMEAEDIANDLKRAVDAATGRLQAQAIDNLDSRFNDTEPRKYLSSFTVEFHYSPED